VTWIHQLSWQPYAWRQACSADLHPSPNLCLSRVVAAGQESMAYGFANSEMRFWVMVGLPQYIEPTTAIINADPETAHLYNWSVHQTPHFRFKTKE